MALELPGWLVTAFNVVGLPWPGIDEDQLRAWATSVRGFATEITDSSARTHQSVAVLAEDSQSSFTDSLAARWEHHNQLIADLHGPIDDFAEALDVAADVVVAQKYAVIAAATTLAGEFVATQIGAFFTFGADEAAVPAEVALTREAVKFALEYLENELLGKLIGMAAQGVSDQVKGFLANLLDDAFPVAMEVQSLKISYDRLQRTADSVHGDATRTEETGERTYRENVSRNIEDSSEGGDDGGDGGRFAAVVQAVEQGLLDVAVDLFRSLPTAIFKSQSETSGILMKAVDDLKGKDDNLAHDVPREKPGNVAKIKSVPAFWRLPEDERVRVLRKAPATEVQAVLKDLPPGEQAAVLENAPLETQLAVLKTLPKAQRRVVFARLPPDAQLEILRTNENPTRSDLFNEALPEVDSDAIGGVATGAQNIPKLFERPPTSSHTAQPVSSHPTIEAQPHAALGAADIVTGALGAAAFVQAIRLWFKRGGHFFPPTTKDWSTFDPSNH